MMIMECFGPRKFRLQQVAELGVKLVSTSIQRPLGFVLAGVSAVCRLAVLAESQLAPRTILSRARTGAWRLAGQVLRGEFFPA